jgi:hypothetical protein
MAIEHLEAPVFLYVSLFPPMFVPKIDGFRGKKCFVIKPDLLWNMPKTRAPSLFRLRSILKIIFAFMVSIRKSRRQDNDYETKEKKFWDNLELNWTLDDDCIQTNFGSLENRKFNLIPWWGNQRVKVYWNQCVFYT